MCCAPLMCKKIFIAGNRHDGFWATTLRTALSLVAVCFFDQSENLFTKFNNTPLCRLNFCLKVVSLLLFYYFCVKMCSLVANYDSDEEQQVNAKPAEKATKSLAENMSEYGWSLMQVSKKAWVTVEIQLYNICIGFRSICCTQCFIFKAVNIVPNFLLQFSGQYAA